MADWFNAFAYNPDTNELLNGATFQVFAEDDLSRANPLAVFEKNSGAQLSPLMSNHVGALPQFSVDGDPQVVVLKSGDFETTLLSAEGSRGPAGKSAFDIAVEAGYEGTEQDLADALAQAADMVVGATVTDGVLTFSLVGGATLGPFNVQGPAGPIGAAIRILGVVDSEEDLPESAELGDGYRIGDDLWVWTDDGWDNIGPWAGEAPELREHEGWVQTKLPSDTEWTDLFEIPTTGASAFGDLTGEPTDNEDLATALGAKASDDAVVKLTGNQTVAGTKTFSVSPVVPDESFTLATITGLVAALAAKAADDAVVKLTGNQTVQGTKTFAVAPSVPDGSFGIAKLTGVATASQGALADTAVQPGDLVGAIIANLPMIFWTGGPWPDRPDLAVPVLWVSSNDPEAPEPPKETYDMWIRHPSAVA